MIHSDKEVAVRIKKLLLQKLVNLYHTARRFCQDPDLDAILSVANVELISRFSIIYEIYVRTKLCYVHGFICRLPYTKFESRNKDLSNFRERHTQKNARQKTQWKL